MNKINNFRRCWYNENTWKQVTFISDIPKELVDSLDTNLCSTSDIISNVKYEPDLETNGVKFMIEDKQRNKYEILIKKNKHIINA